jgi:hypothetical protein
LRLLNEPPGEASLTKKISEAACSIAPDIAGGCAPQRQLLLSLLVAGILATLRSLPTERRMLGRGVLLCGVYARSAAAADKASWRLWGGRQRGTESGCGSPAAGLLPADSARRREARTKRLRLGRAVGRAPSSHCWLLRVRGASVRSAV